MKAHWVTFRHQHDRGRSKVTQFEEMPRRTHDYGAALEIKHDAPEIDQLDAEERHRSVAGPIDWPNR